MTWTELLKDGIESTYGATEGLLRLVEPGDLGWKPASGSNWMTTGQLLRHLTKACGFCCRGLATGDWDLPEGVEYEDMPEEEMLPPAERMPAAESVEQAIEELAADRALALDMLEQVGEEGLESRRVAAPWSPSVEYPLGQHFLHMIGHLAAHKAQLFYYLKLQGKPVHTGHLWGM